MQTTEQSRAAADAARALARLGLVCVAPRARSQSATESGARRPGRYRATHPGLPANATVLSPPADYALRGPAARVLRHWSRRAGQMRHSARSRRAVVRFRLGLERW